MTSRNRQTPRRRIYVLLGSLLLLFGAALVGVAPFAAAGVPIYESAAAGTLALGGDPPPVIVADQFLGVKFHVAVPVTTGSIGGYFAPYGAGVASEIVGAIVRLDGPHDFPDSFDLTTSDVLGQTLIHVTEPAGDYAGNLSIPLTEGWYAVIFAATGRKDRNNAIMHRMSTVTGYPLYFFGRVLDPNAPQWFAYFDGGGLDGVRMFVDTEPVPLVPNQPRLLLGSGLAGGWSGGGTVVAASGVR